MLRGAGKSGSDSAPGSRGRTRSCERPDRRHLVPLDDAVRRYADRERLIAQAPAPQAEIADVRCGPFSAVAASISSNHA